MEKRLDTLDMLWYVDGEGGGVYPLFSPIILSMLFTPNMISKSLMRKIKNG